MYLFEHNKKPFPIPTMARQVFDVSGAGDTVISVFALCLAAGADKTQAAQIANYAAGIVVGKMGAVAVELDELKQAIGANLNENHRGHSRTLCLHAFSCQGFGQNRRQTVDLACVGKSPHCRKELDEVLIACDHEEIFKAAQNFKARVVMTDPHHPSGSDRIAEAVKDLKVDIVVNIQGDEPFIDPRTIDALAVLLKQDAKLMMGTVIKEITDEADFLNPNVVKCVVDAQGYALYFSRSPIPYHRNKNTSSGVKEL